MNADNVIRRSARQNAPYGLSAKRAAPNPIYVRFGAFELDEANARLWRNGTALTLAPRPFGLLCALARRPGSLLTKNALLDDIWGHQFVSDSVLRTAVTEVRTVLDDHARSPKFIETVSRRGYRFIAPTTAVPGTAGAVYYIKPTPAQALCGTAVYSHESCDSRCAGAPNSGLPPRKIAITECDERWLKPAYPTLHEIRYAHELKLRIRDRFLADATAPECARCVEVG